MSAIWAQITVLANRKHKKWLYCLFSAGVKMEIEDLVLSTLVISALGSFFIYAMTNPLPYGIQLLETLAIGGLCAYLFNNPNFL
jgi:hypothetical protein